MNSNFSLIGLEMRFQIYNGEPEITETKNSSTIEIVWYASENA